MLNINILVNIKSVDIAKTRQEEETFNKEGILQTNNITSLMFNLLSNESETK